MGDGRHTVLVADADEGTRALVRVTLDGPTYRVVEADDTGSALRAVATSRPSLLLVDAALPGAGGVAVTRSLKAQPETRDTTVVLLVDRPGSADADAAREVGVTEFLAKPFTAFALLRKVTTLLGG